MKKSISLCIAFIILASLAYAGGIQQWHTKIVKSRGAAASSCSYYISNTTGTSSDSGELYGSTWYGSGQSITGNGGVLCQVCFSLALYSGTPALVINIDSTLNSMSTPLATANATVSGTGEFCTDFEGQALTLTDSTTYYIVVHNSATGQANAVILDGFSEDGYAGGGKILDCTTWDNCANPGSTDFYIKVSTK